MGKLCILLIEDDKDLLKVNTIMLELEGYHVSKAENIKQAKAKMEEQEFDLIILDVLLPDGNGFELCKSIRQTNDVKILFLSALNTKQNVIEGLRAGGDDYLAKPYLTEEFLLRIRALLRRCKQNEMNNTERHNTGIIQWNDQSKKAYVKENNLCLAPKEYSILQLLCQDDEQYFSADEIYEKVWGETTLNHVDTVHNHIYQIRNKLQSYGILILYKRGRGYKIQW